MIHCDFCAFRLGFPQRVHEGIHGAVRRVIGVTIEYGDSEDEAQAFFAGLGVLLEDSALAVKLGLSIEVGWPRRGICLVGRLSWHSREDVVGRDVQEANTLCGGEVG